MPVAGDLTGARHAALIKNAEGHLRAVSATNSALRDGQKLEMVTVSGVIYAIPVAVADAIREGK